MLRVVQRSMLYTLAKGSDAPSRRASLDPFVLTQEAMSLCAELIAAFAKCETCKVSLSDKPETALVLVDTLRSSNLRLIKIMSRKRMTQ